MQHYSLVKTARSAHERCFVCNRSRERLHQVHGDSIVFAYQRFQILIKPHARLCGRHLDTTGRIQKDIFSTIPTTLQYTDRTLVSVLDVYSRYLVDNCGIFDRFRNADFLEEEYFKKITGLSKSEFLVLSRYIKNSSIKDSKGRTKEQLIAIYLYWARKGIDQVSLSMLKSNCSQQEISHYLDQIRVAFNRDFVPIFLGAKSKPRDFFIKCNTSASKILYSLSQNDLLIIADGTYTRLEKSFCNDFQYYTWSQQKYQTLIKPFVICCADGYIIDIYGPFQANQNDAKIFKYVLETDNDLKDILIPKKTVIILDRGNNF